MNLIQKLQLQISEIANREIQPNENLFDGAIDSLSWVRLISVVEAIAKEQGVKIDLESILVSREISIQAIADLIKMADR